MYVHASDVENYLEITSLHIPKQSKNFIIAKNQITLMYWMEGSTHTHTLTHLVVAAHLCLMANGRFPPPQRSQRLINANGN